MLLYRTPMTAVAAHSTAKRRPTPGGRSTSPSPTPPSDEGNIVEDDATKGDWLFKQNELVLGPVTAIVLVEKIKKGELDGDTPVARDGDTFRPMKLVRLFREAWQATVEQKRHSAEERAYQSAVTRAKVGRVFVLLLAFALPAAAAAAASRQVMILRPWDDTPTWIARVPPLVDLPQRPPEVKKADPPPKIADASDQDEDEDEDPTRPGDPTRPKKPKTPRNTNTNTNTATSTSSPGAAPPAPPPPSSVESLSNAQAVAPLKEIQGDLKTCFKAEMESNPDMPAQVVLSYTITEEGKAINVNLDARELRGRPVVPCVQKAVTTLRWPRFSGERKNVSVPFKLGKPKAPGQK